MQKKDKLCEKLASCLLKSNYSQSLLALKRHPVCIELRIYIHLTVRYRMHVTPRVSSASTLFLSPLNLIRAR